MIRLGQFESTQVIPVTDTAPAADDRFTSDISGVSDVGIRRYLLTASATVHIARNEDASTSSAILVANQPYEIELAGSDALSFITATTASLYVTRL
jgi:hypothetical protein